MERVQMGVCNKKIALIDSDTLAYSAASDPNKSLVEVLRDTENSFKNVVLRSGCSHYAGFLTIGSNFRYRVATIKPYKGNRKDTIRPQFLSEAKQHLKDVFGCVSHPDLEADDMVAICATQWENTVLCAVDKDFAQVPGVQFNPMKNQFTRISIGWALYALWLQVLTGDSGDNVEGLPGIGPVKAKRILEGVEPRYYPGQVLDAYIEKFGVLEGIQRMDETFQLLYLRREPCFGFELPLIREIEPIRDTFLDIDLTPLEL